LRTDLKVRFFYAKFEKKLTKTQIKNKKIMRKISKLKNTKRKRNIVLFLAGISLFALYFLYDVHGLFMFVILWALLGTLITWRVAREGFTDVFTFLTTKGKILIYVLIAVAIVTAYFWNEYYLKNGGI
jgi:cation transport ATPase